MGANARLIIVEDDAVLLRMLGVAFSREPDLEVTCCPDGESGLEAMKEPFDVLLTDKNLPGISGLDLARQVRQHSPYAETIILTGYGNLSAAIEAIAIGVFDFVVKPPQQLEHLRHKVRKAIEASRLARDRAGLVVNLQERNGELTQALTDLKGMQSELIQSEKLAGLGTLASGVAHEINSPLFGVLGLAEAIVEETDPAKMHAHARDIIDYSLNIRDIVTQLKAYSRSSAVDDERIVRLDQVFDAARTLVVRSGGVDGAHIKGQLDDSLAVQGWPQEVQQVFINLLTNAAAAKRESGDPVRVTVQGGRDAHHVWVEVSDDGCGIADQDIGSVFDPFFTTKPAGEGTGLGLNIVYRIMTKHQGRVSVQSEPNKGTTFRLEFPIRGPSEDVP